jgi:hypothetical protein
MVAEKKWSLMMVAPVALFVYNRPHHTLKIIDALKRNDLAENTELFIFADGPRSNASAEDLEKINSVRKIASETKGFKKVHLEFAAHNKGLAASLVQGISKVLENSEVIIVVEDDILCSRYFLSYCNTSLEKYKDEERVMSISGFSFPLKIKNNRSYFIRTGPCWGWATWARAWKHFSSDAAGMWTEITSKNLQNEFDFGGNHTYTQMLKLQSEGKINSWAICWYASIFLMDGVILCPAKSLTKNIGMDGSGTNYTGVQQAPNLKDDFSEDLMNWSYPSEIARDMEVHKKQEEYFRKESEPGIKHLLKEKLKKIFS